MSSPEQSASDDMGLQREGGKLSPIAKSEFRRTAIATRPVKINSTRGDIVDEKVVNYGLYNSFNYSLFLPPDDRFVNLSLGITSPNRGEGKTTAVCNLATALALGMGRKTLLIDLNFGKPKLHEVFGTTNDIGISEALSGGELLVTPTLVDNLYVMSAGQAGPLQPGRSWSFQGVIASLYKEFELILLDLPSVGEKDFPTLIANQLTGLIVVVKSRKTRRRDIERLFRKVRKETVQAFVMNEVRENDL